MSHYEKQNRCLKYCYKIFCCFTDNGNDIIRNFHPVNNRNTTLLYVLKIWKSYICAKMYLTDKNILAVKYVFAS